MPNDCYRDRIELWPGHTLANDPLGGLLLIDRMIANIEKHDLLLFLIQELEYNTVTRIDREAPLLLHLAV